MLTDPDMGMSHFNDEQRKVYAEHFGHARLSKGIWQFSHWNVKSIELGKHQVKAEPILDPLELISAYRQLKAIANGDVRKNELFDEMLRDKIRNCPEPPLDLYRRYKKPFRYVEDWPKTPYLQCYGVVDTPEQLLEKYDFEADPRKLMIAVVEIRREDEPPSGGWRYHKWGRYYGTQNPQCEYLYDDKHIEKVYTFHIYELN